MLTAGERAATVESIAVVQAADGLIPRWRGAVADPWTQVEAAMALTTGGRVAEARRAFAWLARAQRPDGAWYQYYRSDGTVEVALLDTNFVAYVATGAWHHLLATCDTAYAACLLPMVERALAFVVRLQRPAGEVVWESAADSALLAASSSVCLSLRCGAALAAVLGDDRAEWFAAAGALADAIALRPDRFLAKDRFAMDWYYPVLGGAVGGEAAVDRLAAGWATFVIDGWGVRCVADRPWVTAAETCEAAIAHAVAGLDDRAARLFEWAQHLRSPDGSYFTGMVQPEGKSFPGGERTTYSAAAVVLADDALAGAGPAAGLFRCPSLVGSAAGRRQ